MNKNKNYTKNFKNEIQKWPSLKRSLKEEFKDFQKLMTDFEKKANKFQIDERKYLKIKKKKSRYDIFKRMN